MQVQLTGLKAQFNVDQNQVVLKLAQPWVPHTWNNINKQLTRATKCKSPMGMMQWPWPSVYGPKSFIIKSLSLKQIVTAMTWVLTLYNLKKAPYNHLSH